MGARNMPRRHRRLTRTLLSRGGRRRPGLNKLLKTSRSWHNVAMSAILPSPAFLYGTAWKEDRTASLTELALRSGFRGIDTANQRRHYFEAGVGEGLAAAYRAGIATRSDRKS